MGTKNTIEGRVAAVSDTTGDRVSLGVKAGKNNNVERSWTPSTRHKRCVLAQRVRFRRMKASGLQPRPRPFVQPLPRPRQPPAHVLWPVVPMGRNIADCRL